MSKRVLSAQALLRQRNVLVSLAQALSQEQAGGVFGISIEMLRQLLSLSGALAYRLEADTLTLVADEGLPRNARPWLKRLTADDAEPWFVAQRVAQTIRSHVDEEVAGQRAGLSIAPTLREAGWAVVAGVPVAIGREIAGVLVMAARDVELFDRELLRTLEAAAGIVALALAREAQSEQAGNVDENLTMQLATVGILAASVAEDMEPALDTMRLQLEFQESLVRNLRGLVEGPSAELDELSELTFEIAAGARRIGDVAMRLQSSSRAEETRVLDLGRVVVGAAAMIRTHVEGLGVALDVQLSEVQLPIDGRDAELRMLIVQLLVQAAAQCEAADGDEPTIVLSAFADEGHYVVCVDSSGSGQEKRLSGSEIFDALLARGRSTQQRNVGMNLAKQTVLAHSGHIEVGVSRLGGAQIRCVFPPSNQSVGPEDRESVPHPTLRPVHSTNPTVLWIEDDEVWTKTVARFLESYTVVVAKTLAEARVCIAGLEEEPDAIFVGVELSDGYGIDLHRELDVGLAVRCVFVSDGVIASEIVSYLRNSGCPTLIKPIMLGELVSILEQGEAEASPRSSVAPTLQPSSRPPHSERP